MKWMLLFFLLLFGAAYGQSDIAETIAKTITVKGLQKDLGVIASADMEGRETGMPGQHKAADYIESRMKAMGLKKPVGLETYQQHYSLLSDSLVSCLLQANEIIAVADTDFLMPLGNNVTGDKVSENILFAGYGIRDAAYDDYAGLDVKGKTVVIFQGEPKKEGKYLVTGTENASDWVTDGPAKKIKLAASLGAVNVLLINAFQESFSRQMINSMKRSSVYLSETQEKNTVNYALISHSFFKKLLPDGSGRLLSLATESAVFSAEDRKETPMMLHMAYEEKVKELKASNVIGIVEGGDLNQEFVFLTAHYDHLGKRGENIYYGADDDGSGTAAVLQMAEAFSKAKKEGHGPRRTVVFMTVSGEEKGLWGSRYYSDHPVFPLDKTSADLNTDMIGRIDTERNLDDTLNYVYVIGHDKISTKLGALNDSVNKIYSGLTLDYKFDDPKDPNRIFFRSDHYNFARKGVPILFFYDGMLKGDYHKPTDTVDKINWELYLKRAKMIFHTAWEVANRDKMLSRDLPLPGLGR